MKFIALLLISGGCAGIASALWSESGAFRLSHLLFLALAMILFGWSVWTGFELWKGKINGHKSAVTLFVLQIPIVNLNGFDYQFYVGTVLGFSFSQGTASKLNLGFELGSRLSLQASREAEGLVVGVNLIALAALTYVIRMFRRAHGSKSG